MTDLNGVTDQQLLAALGKASVKRPADCTAILMQLRPGNKWTHWQLMALPSCIGARLRKLYLAGLVRRHRLATPPFTYDLTVKGVQLAKGGGA